MSDTIRKGLILAAGYGTRFLPATKSTPKEMLPLVDKPAIQYVVEEAADAGISQVIMVTAANKRSVEDYFDREFELERILESRGNTRQLELVREPAGLASMAFVRQKERLGIGHAVLAAQPMIGQEAFALFFPDDVIFAPQPAIGQLIDAYHRNDSSIVAVDQLPREEVVHYGVIDGKPLGGGLYDVRNIVEKPSLAEAPSDLGITGRYVLKHQVFKALEETPPGKGGEIQLTDGISRMLETGERVLACKYEGERFDIGRPIGLLKASIAEGLRRPDIGTDLQDYLRGTLTRREDIIGEDKS